MEPALVDSVARVDVDRFLLRGRAGGAILTAWRELRQTHRKWSQGRVFLLLECAVRVFETSASARHAACAFGSAVASFAASASAVPAAGGPTPMCAFMRVNASCCFFRASSSRSISLARTTTARRLL